jgi:ATP-dependent Clp protease ATP-binding subunit ClpA
MEERLRAIFSGAKDADGDVILFVDEIHSLFANSASGSGPADLLKPRSSEARCRCIGTTTPAEYKKNIEKDSALSRLFAALPVEAPDEDQAIAMCRGIVERYEMHHGVRITDPAVVAAVKLSKRYLSGRELPDKAIDLIDEAAAQCRLALDAGPRSSTRSRGSSRALEAQHRSLVDEEDAARWRCARWWRPSSVEVRQRYEALKRPRWDRQRDAIARCARRGRGS